MLTVRSAAERGHSQHDWLDSWHSFSFAEYHDPAHMGFGPLRVINEDRVQPGRGFGTHAHRDMEIVSYVLEGALSHRDSLGTGSVIVPGDVQRMSAGSGVRHSEFNPSADAPVHFLQIWIEPSTLGIAPGYEQKHIDPADKRGRLAPLANADGSAGAVRIHQDARIHAGTFDGAQSATLELAAGRRVYAHVARGGIRVNGTGLHAGDAAMITGETRVLLDQGNSSEILLFDLP